MRTDPSGRSLTVQPQDFIETILFANPDAERREPPAVADPAMADEIVNLCLREDIAPAVYYLLKKDGKTGLLPAAALRALARIFEMNLAANLSLRHELLRILTRFNEEGLSHILLKGMALAEFYYPSLSMRRMTDVDVLVRWEELTRIDACLKKLGYVAVDSDIEAVVRNPPGYLASLEYHRREGQPPLHIHWRLVNTSVPATMFAPYQSMDRLWECAEWVRMDGVATRILSPGHLLLHLSEHALRINHSFDRLILVYDIVKVLRRIEGKETWENVMTEAISSHLDIFLFCSLAIVRRFDSSVVPSHALMQLRPARLSWGQRLFLKLQRQGKRIRGSSYLIYLSLNKGVYRKIVFVFRTLAPPSVIQRQRTRTGRQSGELRLRILRIFEIIRYLASLASRLFGRPR